MFGDEPALKPEELTYQRMLAGDPIEVAEQARQILKEKPLIEYYDDVLIEALKLAQADSDRGHLDEERKQRIRDVVAEMLEDLEVHEDIASDANTVGSVEDTKHSNPIVSHSMIVPEEWRLSKSILCIPGRDLLGEAFALIVAQLLTKEGLVARVEQSNALSKARLSNLDTDDVGLICLCFVGGSTPAQIGYAIRRLRRKMPTAFILLALIGHTEKEELKATLGYGSIQHTLADTRNEILKMVQRSEEADRVRPVLSMAAQSV